MARTLGELAAQFGCKLIGDPAVSVSGVATLANAGDGDLSFFANRNYRRDLQSTRASVVVACARDADECPVAVLISDEPYMIYARVAHLLHPEPAVTAGGHESACIAASAKLANGVHVSANASICEDTVIGENVVIGPGAVIGPRCWIGDDTKILAYVTLVRDTTLGKRCIVHSGAVLGGDGFGNAMSESGWVKVPQVGCLRIGDDVEIGSNTTIDRGAIDDTVLGNGVRVDNLVQIGHNVRVGDHTAIAAQAGVAGSAIIGQRCKIAGQTGIVGHISICDDVIVGGATMISKDIDQPGFYTGSFPGEADREWKRKVARFRRLGELVDRVRALEEAVKDDN